jgi:hypothetical protein
MRTISSFTFSMLVRSTLTWGTPGSPTCVPFRQWPGVRRRAPAAVSVCLGLSVSGGNAHLVAQLAVRLLQPLVVHADLVPLRSACTRERAREHSMGAPHGVGMPRAACYLRRALRSRLRPLRCAALRLFARVCARARVRPSCARVQLCIAVARTHARTHARAHAGRHARR